MKTGIKIKCCGNYTYDPQEVIADVDSAWRDSVGTRMAQKITVKDFNVQLGYFSDAVAKFASLGEPEFKYESMSDEIERLRA